MSRQRTALEILEDHESGLKRLRASLARISTGGGVDHGGLAGLGDDDHSQYHNDARGDVRYLKLAGGTMVDAIEFENSFGDYAGQIGARLLTGREILEISASTSLGTDDGVRVSLYGPSDPNFPGDILVNGQDGDGLAQWDESQDRWEFKKDVRLESSVGLTAYEGGVADRTLLGNTGCHIYLAAASQTITSGVTNIVQYDTIIQDDEGTMADLAGNRIYARASGWYMFFAQVRWPTLSGASAVSGLRLYLNGSLHNQSQARVTGTSGSYQFFTLPVYMNDGDYVRTRAFQNTGASVNLNAGSTWEQHMSLVAMF